MMLLWQVFPNSISLRSVTRHPSVRTCPTLRLAPALVALAVLLGGCDMLLFTDLSTVSLDDTLRVRLEAAAPDRGLAFYMMPASQDLHSIPQDPRNPLSPEKVRLGRLLFHETGLLTTPSRSEGLETASCASCHHVAAGFQAGRRQGIGEGGLGFGTRGEDRFPNPDYTLEQLDVQPIRSPSAMNGAYQPVMLWNGQFGATGPNVGTEASWTAGTPKETNYLGYQGLETQAIAGLTVHRMGRVDTSVAAKHPVYRQLFERAFPGEPIDQERAGLAIAAYERTLLASEAPFQRWLRGAVGAMTKQQKRGAILFFGAAGCVDCHTGPALNSMTFHALGMDDLRGPDVLLDGDDDLARPEHLGRGGFTGRSEDFYRFKTPQLYNLADSPFLGHGGTFRSVREVIEYKNSAVSQNPIVPAERLAPTFRPLHLSEGDIADLTAFVEEALYDTRLDRYVPSRLPSGNCFPVNDEQSRSDLGCPEDGEANSSFALSLQ